MFEYEISSIQGVNKLNDWVLKRGFESVFPES